MHTFLIWIDMSIIFQNLLNFSFALYAIIKTVLSFLTSVCLQNADLHFYFLRLEKRRLQLCGDLRKTLRFGNVDRPNFATSI